MRPVPLFVPILCAIAALIVLNPARINGDCALYLEMGRMLIEGKLPYVDFGEVNPPLIIYLSAIPNFIASFLGLNLISVFLFNVLGLVVWSILTIRKLLIKSGLGITSLDLNWPLFFLAILSLWIYVQDSFGQREHLTIILFMPYFVVRWIRWQGGSITLSGAIITGITGAIGASIKPFFLLLPLVCELYWLISFRRISTIIKPETIAFAFVGLAYALHFFFLPELVRKTLFEWWLPFVMRTYHAYDRSLVSLIQEPTLIPSLLIAFITLSVVTSRKSVLWSLAQSLSVMALAACFVYIIQRKGFSYHVIPYLGPVLLILGIMASEAFAFSDQVADPRVFRFKMTTNRTTAMVSCLLVILIGSFGWLTAMGMLSFRSGFSGLTKAPNTPMTKLISEYSEPGDRVLVMATSSGPTYPSLLQMGRRPAHRYFFTFWMGMLYAGVRPDNSGRFPYRSEANATPEETRLLRELAEDIEKLRPKLILVRNERGCQGCPENFNIMEYLTANGFIKKFMSDYEFITNKWGFAVFVPTSSKISQNTLNDTCRH